MTAQTKTTLKGYFNTTDVITETNLANFIDTIGGLTLTVAANDASNASKGRADYVCDGTNDEIELDAAVTAISSIGAGRIILTEGTFNRTTTWNTPSNIPIIIEGQGLFTYDEGWVGTVITFTLAGAGNCINFSTDFRPQRLQGFAIVGDTSNTEMGIYLNDDCVFKEVKDVLITDVTDYGIKCEDLSSQSVFERVYCRDLPNLCIDFEDWGTDNRWEYCQASRASGLGVGTYYGFNFHGPGTICIGCVAEYKAWGYNIGDYAWGITIVNCYAEECDVAIRVTGTPNDPKGIAVIGLLSSGMNDATDAAVHVVNCQGFTLINPEIVGTTSNKSIQLETGADTVTVLGGNLEDSTPLTDNGATNVQFINVRGYKNEAEGAATSISDGGTIAHGLSGTPTVAICSPSVASEMVSVTGLDGTNITVAIKQDDGTAGTSQTIYWRAWI